MIERMSSTRVTVAFHRTSSRELWRRDEIMDDWVNSRNTDLADIYEWRGYSFFYARFASRADGEQVGPIALRIHFLLQARWPNVNVAMELNTH